MQRLFLCLLTISLLLVSCGRTSESFQNGADVVRLKHLKYYADLIAEYHSKTGRYPLQDKAAEIPVYVIVGHDKQIPSDAPPFPHLDVPMREWVKDLEAGVGRPIDEHYDPQLASEGYKPNFYIYMIHRQTYAVAVHLYQDYSFANHVAEHYNKVEVSNEPRGTTVDPGMLFTSEAFLNALKAPYKVGFFEERDAQYLHFTKHQH